MNTINTITEPAALPLTLDEVKAHLRLETTDDDEYLMSLIEAATKLLDGPEGCLSRCLVQRQIELQIPGWTYACRTNPQANVELWSRRQIELPLPPFVSLEAVTYLDSSETEQQLDPADFVVVPQGLFPAVMMPILSGTWPTSAADRPDAIRVLYTAGYAEVEAGGTLSGVIPRNIIQAMYKAIGTAWENRDQPADVYIDETLILPHRTPVLA